MPASMVVGFSTNTISDNQTRQLGAVSTSNNVNTGAQEYVQTPCREAGTFDRAYCTISANTVPDTCLFRFRPALGVNGNMVIAIGPLQTGQFEDLTNSDHLDDDAYFNWQLSAPNTTESTSITIKTLAARFTPDNPNKTISWVFGGGSGQTYSSANTTTYTSPSGSIKSIANEDDCKIRITGNFLARNMAAMVPTNPRTSDTIVRNRINGANGNQVIVIGAAQTGWLEDTEHTDQLEDGDDYAYSITTGSGTGTINIRSISNTLESTEGQFLFAAGAPDAVLLSTPGDDVFFPPSANAQQHTVVEADAQIRFPFACALKRLTVRSNVSFTTAPNAVKLRVNGADGNVGIVTPASTVGVFDDTEHADQIQPGDEVAIMIDLNSASTGNIRFHQFTLLGEHPSSGGGDAKPWLYRSFTRTLVAGLGGM